MVYDHEKVPQIYLWWAKFVENYRVFTGNIGKGCMRSQEVNNKITPWSWVWILRYFIRFISIFICIVWRSKKILFCMLDKKRYFFVFLAFATWFFLGSPIIGLYADVNILYIFCIGTVWNGYGPLYVECVVPVCTILCSGQLWFSSVWSEIS